MLTRAKANDNAILEAIRRTGKWRHQAMQGLVDWELNVAYRSFPHIGKRARDELGRTPAMLAVIAQNFPALSWLLDKTKHSRLFKPSIPDLGATCLEGYTALMYAVQRPDTEVASLESRDEEKAKPLPASLSTSRKIIDLLLDRQAGSIQGAKLAHLLCMAARFQNYYFFYRLFVSAAFWTQLLLFKKRAFVNIGLQDESNGLLLFFLRRGYIRYQDLQNATGLILSALKRLNSGEAALFDQARGFINFLIKNGHCPLPHTELRLNCYKQVIENPFLSGAQKCELIQDLGQIWRPVRLPLELIRPLLAKQQFDVIECMLKQGYCPPYLTGLPDFAFYNKEFKLLKLVLKHGPFYQLDLKTIESWSDKSVLSQRMLAYLKLYMAILRCHEYEVVKEALELMKSMLTGDVASVFALYEKLCPAFIQKLRKQAGMQVSGSDAPDLPESKHRESKQPPNLTIPVSPSAVTGPHSPSLRLFGLPEPKAPMLDAAVPRQVNSPFRPGLSLSIGEQEA